MYGDFDLLFLRIRKLNMDMGIYKIINVVNNKFYIGSAVNFKKRKSRHWCMLRRGTHSNKHLQSAWSKYGENAFIFVKVEIVTEEEDLLSKEDIWLLKHVGKDYCYNIATQATAPTKGMCGNKNYMWGKTFSHTEQAKQRISKASSARIQSEEEKQRRRNTMRGHKVSEYTRSKISDSLKGDKNPNYGKPRTESFCAQVSKKILVINIDGSQKEYGSIQSLREHLGLKPSTVNRALKSGKPISKGPHAGLHIKAQI